MSPRPLWSGSSVKPIQSVWAAVQADDTVTVAKSNARMKTNKRFIGTLLAMKVGKGRPFAWARRSKCILERRSVQAGAWVSRRLDQAPKRQEVGPGEPAGPALPADIEAGRRLPTSQRSCPDCSRSNPTS